MAFCLVFLGALLSWRSYSRLYEVNLVAQGKSPAGDDIGAEGSESTRGEGSPVSLNTIVVEASGQVVNPGVYQVAGTARIGDVLDRAGGLKKEADQQFVAKNLYLAQSVTDGQKIYIPFQDEFLEKTAQTVDAGASTTLTALTDGAVSENKISINTAGLDELQTLKGIGKVRAEAIVAGRPYATIDDLVESGVLGKAVFESIVGNLSL